MGQRQDEHTEIITNIIRWSHMLYYVVPVLFFIFKVVRGTEVIYRSDGRLDGVHSAAAMATGEY